MALSPRARDLPARPSPGVNNATSSNTSSSDSPIVVVVRVRIVAPVGLRVLAERY